MTSIDGIFKYTAKVSGKINRQPLRLTGKGELRLVEGTVRGSYKIEKIADKIDTLVLDSVLITGYPSACKAAKGISNPFQSGSYEYTREIEFEGGGNISYHANCICDFKKQILTSTFNIRASLPPMQLKSCLPIVETWIPGEEGKVIGTFSIIWETIDGGHIRAIAKTNYSLPEGASLNKAHRRKIILINERPSPRSLLVRQESELCQM